MPVLLNSYLLWVGQVRQYFCDKSSEETRYAFTLFSVHGLAINIQFTRLMSCIGNLDPSLPPRTTQNFLKSGFP